MAETHEGQGGAGAGGAPHITLYIVQGATGEYSDYQEWFAMGFFDHAQAQAHRDRLEEKARECGVYECHVAYGKTHEMTKPLLELDEFAHSDYTGLTYFISECPVAARGIVSAEGGETRSGSTPKGQEPGPEGARP